MKARTIIVSATMLGLLMPLFWGILGFIFFNARNSRWTDFFWNAYHFSCPFWNIQGDIGFILTPLLNGFLYGFVTCLAVGLKSLVSFAKE
ncbi:MAG TPA: hypothetical protein VK699_08305 [Terriglobales bacterium]|nr:hypothetical protein [Terriglobales bacterium]